MTSAPEHAPLQEVHAPGLTSSATNRPDTEIVFKTIEAKEGTSLSSIALNYFKETNVTLIDLFLELNPEITNPDLILVNQKIRIPEMAASLWIRQSSNGVWKVHLSTFVTRHEAVRYMDDIDIDGGTLEIVPRKVTPRITWYRVMAGPFADKDEALKAVEEMTQKGLLRSFRQS